MLVFAIRDKSCLNCDKLNRRIAACIKNDGTIERGRVIRLRFERNY